MKERIDRTRQFGQGRAPLGISRARREMGPDREPVSFAESLGHALPTDTGRTNGISVGWHQAGSLVGFAHGEAHAIRKGRLRWA